jgi:hypothetical protein
MKRKTAKRDLFTAALISLTGSTSYFLINLIPKTTAFRSKIRSEYNRYMTAISLLLARVRPKNSNMLKCSVKLRNWNAPS